MKDKTITTAGLSHLVVVYIVWGSTYLAIRIAVREGSGFPPFTMGASRTLAAGALLLLWAGLKKHRIKPTRVEWVTLVSSGLLLWPIANGLVTWAEVRADSALAALIVGSMPIWTAIIEAIVDRKMPSVLLIASLVVGFSGIGLLAAPSLTSGIRADLLSTLALIVASISWATGSFIQSRKPVALQAQASSGYQFLIGGLGFLVVVLFNGEPMPTPNRDSWLAFAYLVVFGSLLAYTSYVTVLKVLPINIVMTYPYVNPVIAVILGSLILGEEITSYTIGGTVLVLLGVAGVFQDRFRNRERVGE